MGATVDRSRPGDAEVDVAEPTVILRYKDPVPTALLIAHVALMFFSMLIGMRTALGALAARTKGIQTSIDHIGDQVERMELRNQAWEARTRAQFNSLELLLAEYQTTGNYLTQQIAGLQNLNNYVANKG